MGRPITSRSQLNVRGRLTKGVAIIGSRWPPPGAAAFAYSLAYGLGEAVVAGLAPGIDAAAHRGAMAAGYPTVAFVGYGFGATDPPEHAELEEEIVRSGGAVATQLPAGTPATDETRIARDRLQAEYSRAVVLVCSEAEGGALYTMEFARELGKPRFAVLPPSAAANDAAWAGNLLALRDGATPLPFEVNAALRALANG